MVAVISGGPVPVVAQASEHVVDRQGPGSVAVSRIAAVTPAAAVAATADTLPRPLAYGVNGRISSHDARRTRDQRRGDPDKRTPGEAERHQPGDIIDKEI